MKVIENYFYTKSHEWIQLLEDGTALIGLSDYAQNELGDLVFVNLPEVGDDLIVGDMFADVESVKAVSDVFAPIYGKVLEINKERRRLMKIHTALGLLKWRVMLSLKHYWMQPLIRNI